MPSLSLSGGRLSVDIATSTAFRGCDGTSLEPSSKNGALVYCLHIYFLTSMHMSIHRRNGANWFQSNVTLTTLNLTASPCTSSPLTDGDYCSPPQMVTFEPGETEVALLIPIINDTVAEDTENFTLSLSSPSAAVLTGHTSTTISITDLADCMWYTLTSQVETVFLRLPFSSRVSRVLCGRYGLLVGL